MVNGIPWKVVEGKPGTLGLTVFYYFSFLSLFTSSILVIL